MIYAVRVFAIALIGAVVGLGSTFLALDNDWFAGRRHFGPWATRPGSGVADIDPYTAAIIARTGEIPLGPEEGLALEADADSAGVPLDPACHYSVEGPVPAAALWTFVASGRDGSLPAGPPARFGFTSRDAVRTSDGQVRVTLGPTIRPWNYVPTWGLTTLRLTLRLYGSASADLPADGTLLPSIIRETCS